MYISLYIGKIHSYGIYSKNNSSKRKLLFIYIYIEKTQSHLGQKEKRKRYSYIQENTIQIYPYIGKHKHSTIYRENTLYIEKYKEYIYSYIYREIQSHRMYLPYIYREKQSTFPAIKEKKRDIYIYKRNIKITIYKGK